MMRIIPPLCLALLVVGCTKEEDYVEIAREQRAAYKEMTDVLATVKDASSMDAAKTALDEKAKKFEAISRKAQSMPSPPSEVAKRLREDGYLLEGVLKGLQAEVKRVRELPGGPEFLKQFDTTSPGLFSAVQR